jgi:hypothetical protein
MKCEVCFCLRGKRFTRTCSSSSPETLRQRKLVRNWILELRSSKNKLYKHTKCGARSENPTSRYQAEQKKAFLKENHSSH